MQINQRIETLIKQIQVGVIGKGFVFKLLTLALLAGESIFLLGRPGIAKSLLARRAKFLLKDGTNFEYLMNRFSAPEEIFGPISILALKSGDYERNIENYLPTANVAFLDEIWKAGSSIQNTLLTIINEKIYLNGKKTLNVPLRLLISASNELPSEGEGLEALYDRFIIRLILEGLQTKKDFDAMLKVNNMAELKIDENLQITAEEYATWTKKIYEVAIDDVTLKFIDKFRKHIDDLTKGTAYISDRRWKKIVHLMQTSAFFNNRKKIDKSDWLIIPYCIWDNEDQEQQYTKVFNEFLVDNLLFEIHDKREKVLIELEEMKVALEALSDDDVVKNVYHDIFSGKVKGDFYRLLWFEENLITFLKITDYRKLQKKQMFEITLYSGNDLRKLNKTTKKTVRLKNDSTLADVQSETEYFLEIKDSEKTELVKDLTTQLEKINKKLEHLEVLINQEKERLKASENIFFTEEWRLKINQIFDFASEEIEAEQNDAETKKTSEKEAPKAEQATPAPQ